MNEGTVLREDQSHENAIVLYKDKSSHVKDVC